MPKIFKDKNNNVLYTGYETSEVVANPTLAGTEADLTGVQIGSTKYKVPSGGGTGGIEYVDIDVSQATHSNEKWEGSITNSDKEKLLNGANIKTYNLNGNIGSAVCYLDRFSATQNVYKSLMDVMLVDDDQPYFYMFEYQIVEIDLENNTYIAYYEQLSLPTLS